MTGRMMRRRAPHGYGRFQFQRIWCHACSQTAAAGDDLRGFLAPAKENHTDSDEGNDGAAHTHERPCCLVVGL